MCGFNNCSPLDSNSLFLIENKNDDVKKCGSLWLCQKPFDIGYSVSLRNANQNRIGQGSSLTNGDKGTWKFEDDDLIDTDELLDENDRKKPDVKSKFHFLDKIGYDAVSNLDYDCGTTSSGIRKACKNCTCGLAQELEQEEHTAAKQTIKSSCGSVCLAKRKFTIRKSVFFFFSVIWAMLFDVQVVQHVVYRHLSLENVLLCRTCPMFD